jgi:hypothetical protein
LKRTIFSFLILIVIIGSCGKPGFNESDQVLARVYDSYLYVTDLGSLIEDGTTAADSVLFVRSFVDNWIKDQLLLYQAEKNLTNEQKNFEDQLRDYRNSLIVYKYETELINQNLDTLVENREIEEYYYNNQKNFQLKDNIVQAVYVKIKSDSPKIRKILQYAKSDKQSDRDSLESNCMRYAEDFQIIDHEWITFDDLLDRLPLEVYNQESFLRNNSFIQVTEEDYTFLANIFDYRLSESLSPLSQEYNNIKSIILNLRKRALIKQMHQKIYDEALKKEEFEYF